MSLTQGDWYYDSVLSAKKASLKEFIRYIHALEDSMDTLTNQANIEACKKAIEECKALVITANEAGKGALDVMAARNKLLPLSNIIPEVVARYSGQLNACLNRQDQSELAFSQVKLGLAILGVVLFIAAVVAIITATALFQPEGLFIIPLVFGTIASILSMGLLGDYINFRNNHLNAERTIVTDRAAMNIEELHAQLYPTKVNTAVLLSESRDSIFAVATPVNDDNDDNDDTVASAPFENQISK